MKLTVTKDFDYRHPSGMAVTALKADPEPITTKREIAEYAVKMGFGQVVPASGGEVKASAPHIVGEKPIEHMVAKRIEIKDSDRAK